MRSNSSTNIKAVFPAFLVFFLIGIINLTVTTGITSAQENEGIPVLAGVQELYKRTIAKLKMVGSAIDDYIMDNEKAPEAETIDELLKMDSGNGLTFAQFYMDEIPSEKIPSTDMWGNKFLYKADGARFYLASSGSDGEFKGFDQFGIYLDTNESVEGKDIIYSNQGFIFFPVDKKEAEAFEELLLILFPFFRVIF